MRMNKKKSIQDGRLHSQRTIQQTILSWSSLDVSFHLTMEFILTVRLQFHDPSCQPCALRNSIEPQWRQRCPPRHNIGRQPCVSSCMFCVCVCVCVSIFLLPRCFWLHLHTSECKVQMKIWTRVLPSYSQGGSYCVARRIVKLRLNFVQSRLIHSLHGNGHLVL
jgi:hypothetical protein